MAVAGTSATSATGWWLASDGKWYPPERRPAKPVVKSFSGGDFVTVTSLDRPPVDDIDFTPPPRRILTSKSLVLAGVGGRAFAFVVDTLIGAMFAAGSAMLALYVATGTEARLGIGIGLFALFVLWYHVWKIATTGQTWAMHFCHINVAESETGQHPIGLVQASVRALTACLLGITVVGGILDYLWPLWDPQNRTLHDRAAGTTVVQKR